MDFRTEIKVEGSSSKINYGTPVMFAGSCFAVEVADMMKEGLLPVFSNPSGVLYNPASVAGMLRNLISGKVYTEADLWFHNNKWLSFSHSTDFSSDNRESCLAKINNMIEPIQFLQKGEFLFVTFGTARVFRRADTGEIVSNCHKIPSSFFTREMLTVDNIVEDWTLLLNELNRFNPSLKVVFTVSPVRHWKDGAHGNQISKSVLLLAVEELQKHSVRPAYFQSYELVMDDLRDYRFYNSDMLHPSPLAIEYIWDKFTGAYFDKTTLSLYNEISSITRASRHRIMGDSKAEITEFSETMLKKISEIEKRSPSTDFQKLKNYFRGLSHL